MVELKKHVCACAGANISTSVCVCVFNFNSFILCLPLLAPFPLFIILFRLYFFVSLVVFESLFLFCYLLSFFFS